MGGPQDPKAFETATDAAAAGGSGAVNRICEPCQRNFIKIRYEYEDSTGVPGAGYVVQTVTADGTPTGEILAEGKTDQNGDAHVPLPEDYSQVEFYFHDDPEGTEYVDPDAAKPLEEPEPGFFEWLWSNITDAADWVWGVLKGDFEEDPDTSQIIGRMILTMIPGIDQLADVQDIVNCLYRLVWKRDWDNPMHWIMLLITLIGLVPVLGSLAKGILKMVLKKVGDLPGLYGVFNFFKKGNAHRWIRDFANDLTGKHLDAAVALLTGMMVRVASYMEKARGWIPWSSWNNTLEDGLVRVGAFQTAAPGKLSEAAADLQKKLLDTLAVAMTRIEKKGTRNNAPHTVRQGKVEPPKRFPRSEKEYEDLARDPAHGGAISDKTIREREVGVGLEEAGEVPGPITRDPTGGSEFIDANGQAWDVKGFNSNFPPRKGGFDLMRDAGKIDSALATGENIMLDTAKLTAEHADLLRAEGITRGWGDRVKFW